MKKQILFVIACCIVTFDIHAQEFRPYSEIDSAIVWMDSLGKVHFRAELDIKDIPAIETAAKQLVIDFNENLGKLWHQWTPIEIRDYSVQERSKMKDLYEMAILELFIAKAEKYITTEESRYLVRDGYYYNRKGIRRQALNPVWDGNVLRESVIEDIEHPRAIIEITNRHRKSSTKKEVIRYLNNVKNMTSYKQVMFNAGGFTVTNLKKNAQGKYECTVCYHQHFIGIRADGGRYEDDTYRCITIHIEPIIKPTPDGAMIYWDLKLGDVEARETT